MDSLFQRIAEEISSRTANVFTLKSLRSVGGGCINQAYCLNGLSGQYFVKTNSADSLSMFECEAAALDQMFATQTVRIPRPICYGKKENRSYLVLEYINLVHHTQSSQVLLGEQLAAMHRCQGKLFGWDRNNTIGSTKQINSYSDSWIEFYRKCRLMPQFQMAKEKGMTFDGEKELLSSLEFFFDGYEPLPSMLHGDLWGGNVSADSYGNPVLYDPAFYYGDRETDVAFTYMFGGFSSDFYSAYNKAWPLHDGFSQRKLLYNLYHELNHFNLFSGGYANQAQSSIRQLLSFVA